MSSRAIRWCAAVVAGLWGPALALAASNAPAEIVDARLEGYGMNVTLEGGSTAMTWMLLIVLGVLGLAVLFKDAKRTHLD